MIHVFRKGLAKNNQPFSNLKIFNNVQLVTCQINFKSQGGKLVAIIYIHHG